MELPEGFKERYIARRVKDLELCLGYLKVKEFKALEKTGHQMKGSAETFGHYQLAELGMKLEKAAEFKNSAQIEVLLNEFANWLRRELN